MIDRTVTGEPNEDPNIAAISVVRRSIKKYAEGAQVVHIILASLIKSGKKWTAVASVVREKDVDIIPAAAITFCHLPNKYNDQYEALLPEVDHVNLIDDDSIWQNIKTYLLDVYFYQAVHFRELERITETGGGYFKESAKDNDTDPDTIMLTLDLKEDPNNHSQTANRLFDPSFYKATEVEKVRVFKCDEDKHWREHVDPKRSKGILRELNRFK